jgi:subtilase family serine protease
MLPIDRARLASFLVLFGAVSAAACSSSEGRGTSSTAATDPAAPAATAHAALAGRPAWATSHAYLGDVPAGETVSVQVHFALRNADEARAELAAISDPESPLYGRFLSDAEYAAKYGPTDAEVAAVRAHLESQGLRVTHVPGNRTFVAAEGPAERVGRAFGTRLGRYQVKGEVKRAPVDEPTLPPSIAPRVAGILGLSTPQVMKPMTVKPRRSPVPNAADYAGPTPCSEWYGATADVTDPAFGAYPMAYQVCGYKPAQLRRAYGLDETVRSGKDGTGQSIAVVDAYLSPTLLQDAQTYAAQNDPDYPLATSQLVIAQAPGTATAPDPNWYVEQTLDVEAAHTMAPGAKIVAAVAQSATDQAILAAVNMVIDQKLATIVSNSYGTEFEAALSNALIWESVGTQAGLKGVGLYFSSGDYGDVSQFFGAPTLSFPNSLPTVTAVGGTSLAIGQLGDVQWETGWENGVSELLVPFVPPPVPQDDGGFLDGGELDTGTGPIEAGPPTPVWTPAPPGFFAYGAGGGTSILFPQPSYQAGIVPASLADKPGVPARVVPDVAMLADPGTGFLVGQNFGAGYAEFPVGGTSLSSPLFAGTMAIAQQNARRTFGFANALLYKASKKGAFRDIAPLASPQAVVSSLPSFPTEIFTMDYEGQSIHTTAGYDDTTGLGAPNGTAFLRAVK